MMGLAGTKAHCGLSGGPAAQHSEPASSLTWRPPRRGSGAALALPSREVKAPASPGVSLFDDYETIRTSSSGFSEVLSHHVTSLIFIPEWLSKKTIPDSSLLSTVCTAY